MKLEAERDFLKRKAETWANELSGKEEENMTLKV